MENKSTVGSQFRDLRTIHIAMCVGVLIILSVFRYLVKQNADAVPDRNLVFEIIGVAIGFICLIAARFLFFVQTKSALSVVTLKEKIEIFRGAFIIQMAMLEGAAIINSVFYYLTRNDLHFFIALGILLLMAFRRPTRVIAAMVLFNNMEDKQQIYEDSLPL